MVRIDHAEDLFCDLVIELPVAALFKSYIQQALPSSKESPEAHRSRPCRLDSGLASRTLSGGAPLLDRTPSAFQSCPWPC